MCFCLFWLGPGPQKVMFAACWPLIPPGSCVLISGLQLNSENFVWGPSEVLFHLVTLDPKDNMCKIDIVFYSWLLIHTVPTLCKSLHWTSSRSCIFPCQALAIATAGRRMPPNEFSVPWGWEAFCSICSMSTSTAEWLSQKGTPRTPVFSSVIYRQMTITMIFSVFDYMGLYVYTYIYIYIWVNVY